MTTIKSPCKMVGGKSASAQLIVGNFPSPETYDTYCETCIGGAHVFFAKPPYGHKEILCDLDNNVVTFWMQMVDNAGEMSQRLQQLPYSRDLYYQYYHSLFDGTNLESFDRAIRWFYVLRSTGTGWMRKSPVGWNNTEGNLKAFRNVIEEFETIQQRLRHVLVDNRDVLSTIQRYDSEEGRTFFYCDPPYFGAELYYEASKDGFDHVGLARALNTAQGMVAVSYYDHPLLDELYPSSKWRRVSWEQAKSSQVQHRDRVDYGSEVLLMNYPAAQHSLWETTA